MGLLYQTLSSKNSGVIIERLLESEVAVMYYESVISVHNMVVIHVNSEQCDNLHKP